MSILSHVISHHIISSHLVSSLSHLITLIGCTAMIINEVEKSALVKCGIKLRTVAFPFKSIHAFRHNEKKKNPAKELG